MTAETSFVSKLMKFIIKQIFLLASISGNYTEALFCIQNGADVNLRDSVNNQTALIFGNHDSYVFFKLNKKL